MPAPLRDLTPPVGEGSNPIDCLPGNSAAHIKSSLLGQSHVVLVSGGRLKLGTWQGIYVAEFDGPRTRKVWIQVIPA